MDTQIYKCCNCKTLFHKVNYCPVCHSLRFNKVESRFTKYNFIFNADIIKGKSFIIDLLKILSGLKT